MFTATSGRRSTTSRTTSSKSDERLEQIIKHFNTQAKWHLQQHQMYTQYARYYARYKQQQQQQQHSMKQTKHSPSSPSSVGSSSTRPPPGSDSSCGYYFKSPQDRKRLMRRSKRKRKWITTPAAVESDEQMSSTKESCELAEDIDTTGESDYEIDKGYEEFARQSEKFRKERDANRLKRRSDVMQSGEDDERDTREECVEYVDILRKGPDGSMLPPTALNRKELYEEKYGEAGTKILSLETALQWKFNCVIDGKSPKLWPALPLRFVKPEAT